MDVTSLYFISLSVISVFIYYLLKNKYKVLFLTLLSCAFIATYSYNLLIYVLGYALVNYFIGLKMPDSRFKKLLFISGIVFNLTQLLLLNYVSFTITPILEFLYTGLDLSIISRIIVPIGVSFFTLQGIGYLINVNLGWEKPEKNYIYFLLYIIFFPRFISGPIDRSNLFLPQLRINKTFDAENIAAGFRLILFGLFKKVAIANVLAAVVNDAYANNANSHDYAIWAILFIQPLYLYFDFSGYTDIAIGIGRLFGIKLRPNFNMPFMSQSMTEFWKRFHISLSSWFHDYVFIRASYRYRKWGRKASVFALFLTWILFGIWHGAGWTFMLLGLLQAMAIYYEFSTKKLRVRMLSNLPDVLSVWLGRISTYLFYSLSLVFFFAPDMNSVFNFFERLPLFDTNLTLGVISVIDFFVVFIFIFVILLLEVIKTDFSNIFNKIESFWLSNKIINRIFRWVVYYLLIISIIYFTGDNQEFVYIQF